jgi:hypothetical protein
MSDYIRDIPSDSRVIKIELTNSSATVTFELAIYEGDKDKKLLYLESVEATKILPGWESDIEGIKTATDSALLEETRNSLKEDKEPEENIQLLKSYQVLGSSTENPIIEIIARTYKVEET